MTPDSTDFKVQTLDDHRALNKGLLRDLRRVVHWSAAREETETLERSTEVLDRFEHDIFQFAVVGEVKIEAAR